MAETSKTTLEPESQRARRDPGRARRNYVEDAVALLQQRFREPLRLADIARALYVSPYHLCRLFKEETGMPIHRYLNRLRLRQAVKELGREDTDLARLASDLGFCCQSHFTRAFRKEFGIPPGEARRRVQDRRRLAEWNRSRDEDLPPRPQDFRSGAGRGAIS